MTTFTNKDLSRCLSWALNIHHDTGLQFKVSKWRSLLILYSVFLRVLIGMELLIVGFTDEARIDCFKRKSHSGVLLINPESHTFMYWTEIEERYELVVHDEWAEEEKSDFLHQAFNALEKDRLSEARCWHCQDLWHLSRANATEIFEEKMPSVSFHDFFILPCCI
jgi:hypothetical protein